MHLARSGARGDRRQGRQGTDLPPRLRRAVGRAARRRHRLLARARCRPRSESSGRLVDELFLPGAEPALDRGRRPLPTFDVVLDTVFATATLDRPDRGAARRGRRTHRSRRRAHRGARLRARRAAVDRAQLPGRASGERRQRQRHAVAATVARSRAADADPRTTSASCATCARTATRVIATITPTYSGCPAMREISHDLAHRLQQAGYRDGRGTHPARAGLDERLDHRRPAARSSPRPASRRRTPRLRAPARSR